jgi:Domain of unknown function (DUF5753)
VHDGRQHGWWEPFTDGVQPERFVLDSPARFPALENDATAIHSFDIMFLHGLLQTEDYARAIYRAMLPHHSDDEIEQLVTLRVKRQDALRRTEPPPLEVQVVVDEAVLARPAGGPGVMAAQLAHLCELAELPHVRIQVLPFAAGVLRAHAGRFVLLDIPEELGSDVVYVEGSAGEAYLNQDSDVELYREVFADLVRHALPPAGSVAAIRRYQRLHGSGRQVPSV